MFALSRNESTYINRRNGSSRFVTLETVWLSRDVGGKFVSSEPVIVFDFSVAVLFRRILLRWSWKRACTKPTLDTFQLTSGVNLAACLTASQGSVYKRLRNSMRRKPEAAAGEMTETMATHGRNQAGHAYPAFIDAPDRSARTTMPLT